MLKDKFYDKITVMKRLCVFAHWDRDNIIDDYVVYYLKALKKVCDCIIFVSDTECSPQKIADVADFTIIGRHGEYDFGSYKRGFFFAKDKGLVFDELLLVNDSVYGPFYSLEPIFDKMSKKKCDYWGLTRNNYGLKKTKEDVLEPYRPHIQSYFILLKKETFGVFEKFIKGIIRKDSKNDIIISYEIGLSETLKTNGFKCAVYINRYSHTINCVINKWDRLLKWYKFPFLKTSLVKHGICAEGQIRGWESLIGKDYPQELIKTNAERLMQLEPNILNDMNFYRKTRYIILKNLPCESRIIVIFLEKNIFKILNTLCFNKLKKF